eukprot:GHRR01026385.1.p1 GENE.GHRR01026385.1~~GHRR01026385.1.p1  ORF type:complete len:131 (-),score=30.55 GHRR01026385.1:3-395(-)
MYSATDNGPPRTCEASHLSCHLEQPTCWFPCPSQHQTCCLSSLLRQHLSMMWFLMVCNNGVSSSRPTRLPVLLLAPFDELCALLPAWLLPLPLELLLSVLLQVLLLLLSLQLLLPLPLRVLNDHLPLGRL